ncbi:MAG: prevent-host-death protein [Lachnospiraceae bacterium]|nr:prevent-host-death protein [Lachnospiraceae bacterium]
MPTIATISELQNYERVLEKVRPNAPVYLTQNGYVEYSVHSIEDDEESEKTKAMLKLMLELNKGFMSGGQQGWKTEEDLDRHFAEKRSKKRS